MTVKYNHTIQGILIQIDAIDDKNLLGSMCQERGQSNELIAINVPMKCEAGEVLLQFFKIIVFYHE